MKLISWNVNGLRAALKKDFLPSMQGLDADIICLQETKLQPEQVPEDVALGLPGYFSFWNSAEEKGYSGTAVFTRQEPISVTHDFGDEIHRKEGRIITAEYAEFYLVCCYTPNSQDELKRLSYRMDWEASIRAYLLELDKAKPVILCGDLNVAHQEIDLKNPKTNRKNPGFTDEERAQMTALLEAGFSDTFRSLYPETTEAYSWWSYRANARARNTGWRIDYFVVSDRLMARVLDAGIHPEIHGSDHCPVELILK